MEENQNVPAVNMPAGDNNTDERSAQSSVRRRPRIGDNRMQGTQADPVARPSYQRAGYNAGSYQRAPHAYDRASQYGAPHAHSGYSRTPMDNNGSYAQPRTEGAQGMYQRPQQNGYQRPQRPQNNYRRPYGSEMSQGGGYQQNTYQRQPRPAGAYQRNNYDAPQGGYAQGGNFQRGNGEMQANGYQQNAGYQRSASAAGYQRNPAMGNTRGSGQGYQQGGYQRGAQKGNYQYGGGRGYQQGGGRGGYQMQGGYANARGGFQKKGRGVQGAYNPHTPVEYAEAVVDPNEELRLNKYLANAGVCSRREADEHITAGAVKVNGVVVTELGTKVTRKDQVLFNDTPVSLERKVYILLNKPKDTVTTSDDPQGRQTVMDLVRNASQERIYPVGRLDRNTTGVLLLTNDGDLASKLTHPQYVKKKIYHVWLDKDVAETDLAHIATGIELEDGEIHADAIAYANEVDKNQVGIEIHSGKNRIVRRIFEHLGYRVVKLDRVYFAGLTKKNLARGRWRYLTQQEVSMLKMNAFE